MTEAGWLACDDPGPMLEFLRGKASDRKLQLIASACCRRLGGLLPNAIIRRAVEVCETDADGLADISELIETEKAVARWFQARGFGIPVQRSSHSSETILDLSESHTEPLTGRRAERDAIDAVTTLIQTQPISRAHLAWEVARKARSAVFNAANNRRSILEAPAEDVVRVARETWQAAQDARKNEDIGQTSLIRDIFGNPFCTIAIDHSWLTPSVVTLAQSIYDDRAFDRLPILADALEEAGCTNADILAHCRGPGAHVRGCWVVDLVLGKT